MGLTNHQVQIASLPGAGHGLAMFGMGCSLESVGLGLAAVGQGLAVVELGQVSGLEQEQPERHLSL